MHPFGVENAPPLYPIPDTDSYQGKDAVRHAKTHSKMLSWVRAPSVATNSGDAQADLAGTVAAAVALLPLDDWPAGIDWGVAEYEAILRELYPGPANDFVELSTARFLIAVLKCARVHLDAVGLNHVGGHV